jgi:hypothetical protein
MGQRRNRAVAVSSLKGALTRQFGEEARSVVETHVDARLGGRTGQIAREDLDQIERGIVSSMRQQRGGTKQSIKLSRSDPALSFASSAPVFNQEQRSIALPPATPSNVTPLNLPGGGSNPATIMRSSSSTGGLTTLTRLRPTRPPPYGLSVQSGNAFAQESARSTVNAQPKYPVPKPALLKPVDHWDLMVAYDSAKYRRDEEELHKRGSHALKMKFKKVLDDQMLEIQANAENEKRGLVEEREMMLAQVEENKKYKQEEIDVVHRKRDEQSKINTIMLDNIDKYKKKLEVRKHQECDEMTVWLASEKQKREQEEQEQRIEHAKKCEKVKADLDECRVLRAERLRQEQEEDKRLMRLRNQIADEQEAKKQKALQDRKDHIDRVSKTVGAAIADRDAKDQADLEAKIKRIQEEAARRAQEDAKNRMDKHNAKVKDMCEVREKQIEERARADEWRKEEDARQLALFKEQLEDMRREEREKEEKRRKAREELDKSHIQKMRENAGVHQQHVMMTPRNRKTELGYNRAIFEQMKSEGFMTDAIDMLMANPGKDHHPEGKLIAFPTIPRYTGEIHPIELEQPDV